MTAQDWLPELLDDEVQPETGSSRRRWLIAGALVAALALTAVVVEVNDLTTSHPDGSGAAASYPGAATAATTARPAPVPVVIQAGLSDPAIIPAQNAGPLEVDTQPIQGGVAPDRVPNFDSCQADRATLQYLPVQVHVPESWLSATVEVRPTASTPSDIGRLGFFFQAGRDSTPCPDGAWPTSDSFLASNMGQTRITGYVVLDQAFTPTTPQGRPEVFSTLELRVSNIRFSGRPAVIGPPTIGSLCPGTSNELCASLG